MRRTTPSRRGMTLLEVVLAVTILAALSGLVATMWRQSERMSREALGGRRELRLARVVEMLRSQWADRRTSVRLGREGGSVLIEREALTFISATSILEPDWPLVRARFIVERDDRSPGPLEAWRLVYEELPIANVDSVQAPADEETLASSRPALGAPPMRRLTLLAACPELRWERFGFGDAVESEPGPVEAEPAVNPEEPDALARAKRIISADDRLPAWREITTEYRGRPWAVRLRGIVEEKEFSCVLIIGDSR